MADFVDKFTKSFVNYCFAEVEIMVWGYIKDDDFVDIPNFEAPSKLDKITSLLMKIEIPTQYLMISIP